MTRTVITTSLENTVGEAMKLMVEKHIHRVVVTETGPNGARIPVGVLSTTDIVREMRGSRWMWYFSPNP